MPRRPHCRHDPTRARSSTWWWAAGWRGCWVGWTRRWKRRACCPSWSRRPRSPPPRSPSSTRCASLPPWPAHREPRPAAPGGRRTLFPARRHQARARRRRGGACTGAQIQDKLRALKLNNDDVVKQEEKRIAVTGDIDTPTWVKLPFLALCWVLDVVYDNRPIPKCASAHFWRELAAVPQHTRGSEARVPSLTQAGCWCAPGGLLGGVQVLGAGDGGAHPLLCLHQHPAPVRVAGLLARRRRAAQGALCRGVSGRRADGPRGASARRAAGWGRTSQLAHHPCAWQNRRFRCSAPPSRQTG